MEALPYRVDALVDEPRLDGKVLVAMTLDLLLRSETTEFALVDFKRTNPNPKYSEDHPTYCLCANPRYHPGYASSPLVDLEDSKYEHSSLTSLQK